MIELSERLQAVADMLGEGMVVADIGTDHGYIPIYLVQTGKSPKAFAMDVNKGPLGRANEHIRMYHLEETIECRLSNGLDGLCPGECDAVVIAGMGGALTVQILREGREVLDSLQEFVLQPQSEIWKVREYLTTHGYRIVAEDMVKDGGKYYPMMRVVKGTSDRYTTAELKYGKLLLENKNPVLKEFLEKRIALNSRLLEEIGPEAGRHLAIELEEMQSALQRYYKCN